MCRYQGVGEGTRLRLREGNCEGVHREKPSSPLPSDIPHEATRNDGVEEAPAFRGLGGEAVAEKDKFADARGAKLPHEAWEGTPSQWDTEGHLGDGEPYVCLGETKVHASEEDNGTANGEAMHRSDGDLGKALDSFGGTNTGESALAFD